ncbi:Glucose-resistance amylase regulator [Sedimentisphaera cyanobacteriorum]|uniref:Glucose-resistance amylase regulator n=1 Tax=Sedimentisphaera cyanobacteriorum TaxID=1940790 RepID=A0A1Q2HSM7_9BACT|nr:LacI family DNA-binding transcriptional regulator [Sedimentisphaera cyanobacteriorum]AQQ10266.1 Glucose-resistance amylase regulator [Sedimentisphaera cyanobacteriorum]
MTYRYVKIMQSIIESEMMAQNITLQNIADHVGVSKSTVSDVLRNRRGKVKVSEKTREKIHAAVKELGYIPNAAAKALVTGKTGNIGFLLSSKVNHGLANPFFASIMAGVQAGATSKGYNCIVNCYDLSTVKDFVMPSKLKRKFVDGLVISGRIEEDILQMFIDSGIPFILVGINADFPVEGVLSVTRNLKDDWKSSFDYLVGLGHRNIAVGGIETELAKQIFREAVQEYKDNSETSFVKFSNYTVPDDCNDVMNQAVLDGKKWAHTSTRSRPTAVIGHDQWCTGFMKSVFEAGYSCPQDVSILCTCDTILCKWSRPSMTAINLPMHQAGTQAACLLIDYIDRNVNWIETNRRAGDIWKVNKLTERQSTGHCPV